MIVSFLFHPIAFVLAMLPTMGYMAAMDPPEDSWVPVVIWLAIYLLLCWVLPAKTRPGNWISARKRHELLWGKESAAEKYDS